ncbi:MAG: TonB-dependent receptor [Blastochloris sp.]|nr:TonB-dependent receptor [Blastochloris sp.]
MSEVVVKGNADRSLVSGSSGEAQEKLNLVAGGTNFIQAEDYKKGRASNLQDVLGFQPGVLAVSRFGSEEARISIRGSGIQRTFHGRGIKVLQDGLTLNEADGGFDMQAFEPLAYQHIEVFRGANALQYGSSTLGGAINFVTPTGYDSSLAQIRLEAGSYGTWKGQISSGHVAGPFDYYATVTQSAVDGFRDYSQQNNQRVFANIGWRVNDDVETRFYFNYAKSDSELPGSLTKEQAEQNPSQASAGNVTRIDKRDFTYYRAATKTTALFDQARLDAGFYWSNKDLDHPIFNILSLGPGPGIATGPGTIDFVSNNFGSDIKWTDERDLFGRKNTFVIGISPNGSITEDARFENLNNTEARGRQFGDGTEESWNFEVYAQNDHQLTGPLYLITGIQAVYAQREFIDQFLGDGNASDHQDYYGISPKIGLRYDLQPQTNIFLNLSRSYEPPTFGELKTIRGNFGVGTLPSIAVQNLDAQEATTIEIGSRGVWDRFQWDAAFYHAWVDKELLQYEILPNTSQTINGTATHHQGVELGLDVTLWDALLSEAKDESGKADRIVLKQVYNWSNFYFDSDPAFGSNQLAGIPEHFYKAELLYEHPCGFYFGPNVEWSMEKYAVDFANTLFADAYATLGFKAGYQSKRGFSVFVEGKNLTDEEYIATTGVIDRARTAAGGNLAQFNPAEGIGFYGGVEWKY